VSSDDYDITISGDYSFTAVTLAPENSTTNVYEVAAVYSDSLRSIVVKPNTYDSIKFVASILQNRTEEGDALATAKSQFDAALGDDDLFEKHVAGWEELWNSSRGGGTVDVTTSDDEANNELNRIIHSSLYAMLTSIRSELPFGMSPGGLSTNGYKGHTFWDQETWMVPPLLAIGERNLSESILEYRVETLGGAEQGAIDNGWEGAQFAWESCVSGHEEYWYGECGTYEHHITSDVVNAFQQRFYAFKDVGWLERVSDVIFGAASFWAIDHSEHA